MLSLCLSYVITTVTEDSDNRWKQIILIRGNKKKESKIIASKEGL